MEQLPARLRPYRQILDLTEVKKIYFLNLTNETNLAFIYGQSCNSCHFLLFLQVSLQSYHGGVRALFARVRPERLCLPVINALAYHAQVSKKVL